LSIAAKISRFFGLLSLLPDNSQVKVTLRLSVNN